MNFVPFVVMLAALHPVVASPAKVQLSQSGDTALFQAIRAGNLAAVEDAVRKKANANALDAGGKTPLLLAVEAGRKDIVHLLIQRGARVYAKDKVGRTPVSVALERNNTPILQTLLTEGGSRLISYSADRPLLPWLVLHDDAASVRILLQRSVDPQSAPARTALATAVVFASRDIITMLFKHGVDPNAEARHIVSRQPCIPLTLIPTATQDNGNALEDIPQRIQLLLQAGADVNKQDSVGQTALMYAVSSPTNDLSAVDVLLAAGANPDIVDTEGKNAAAIAREASNTYLAEYVEKYKADPTAFAKNRALFTAVKTGSVAAVQTALQAATVDTYDANGHTPLIEATIRGDVAVMELLLKAGADPNRADVANLFHYTPMMWAADKDHAAAVRLLASYHADPHVRSSDQSVLSNSTALAMAADNASPETVAAVLQAGTSRTEKQEALMQAAYTGKYSIMRLLLQHGATVDVRNHIGDTVLRAAAGSGSIQAVKLLLQHSASVNTPGRYKETPLYAASEVHHLEMVQYLLDHRAKIDLANKNGTTPLMTAAARGNAPIVRLLLSRGADVAKRDHVPGKTKKTALGYALENGHEAVIQALKRAGAQP